MNNDRTTESRFKCITHAHIWHEQTILCKVSEYPTNDECDIILICVGHDIDDNDITID